MVAVVFILFGFTYVSLPKKFQFSCLTGLAYLYALTLSVCASYLWLGFSWGIADAALDTKQEFRAVSMSHFFSSFVSWIFISLCSLFLAAVTFYYAEESLRIPSIVVIHEKYLGLHGQPFVHACTILMQYRGNGYPPIRKCRANANGTRCRRIWSSSLRRSVRRSCLFNMYGQP